MNIIKLHNLSCETYFMFLNKETNGKQFIPNLFEAQGCDNYIKFPREFGKMQCFSGFWQPFGSKKFKNNFYFGFLQQPYWMPKLVDELNELFKNITVNLIWKTPTVIYVADSGWGEDLNCSISERDGYIIESGLFVYNIKISDKIPIEVHDKITYTIHHILRECSFSEGQLDPSDPEVRNPVGSLLDLLLDRVNKSKGGYRALSEKFITKEDIKALDDINALELLHKHTKTNIRIKQTDSIHIISMLSRYGENYFNLFDWQKAKPIENPRTFYSIVLNTSGFMQVLRKPTKNFKFFSYGLLDYSKHTYRSKFVDFPSGKLLNSTYSKGTSNVLGNLYGRIIPFLTLFYEYPEMDFQVAEDIVNFINEKGNFKFVVPEEEKFWSVL